MTENPEFKAVQALIGLRILIVEDEFLMARRLETLLKSWGCEVVGPAASLDEGNRLAQDTTIDAALLDINLRGVHSGPIADSLLQRGRPLIFVTGYASPKQLPDHLRAQPRLHKPVRETELRAAMISTFVQ